MPACATCGVAENLKLCSRCKTVQYCSVDCQKAAWKTHKKLCKSDTADNTSTSASSSQEAPAPQGLNKAIDKPFHKLDAGTWLHNRPEEDVYKLLIDTFRLRLNDDYVFDGDAAVGSVFDGRAHSLPAFKAFLQRVERKPQLLPPWWSAEKAKKCIALGMKRDGWPSLTAAPEKSDFIEHYGDAKMPMQLRMLGEQIYERGPGGHDGTAMRRSMMRMENGGEGFSSSMIDMSSMFQRM